VLSSVKRVLDTGAKVGRGEGAPVGADDVIQIGDFAVQLLELHQAAPTPGASSARQVAASPFDFGLAGGGDTVPGDDPFRGLDELMPAKPQAPAAPPAPDPFMLAPKRSASRQPEGLVEGLGALSHVDLGHGADSTDPLANLLNSSPGATAPLGPTFNPQPLGPSAASLDQILGRGPSRPIGQPLVDLARQHSGGASNVDHVQPINMAFTAPSVHAEARPVPPAPPAPPARAAPGGDPFEGFDPFGSLIRPRSAERVAPTAAPPAPPVVRPEPEPEPAPAPPPILEEKKTFIPQGQATSAMTAFLEGAGLTHLQVSDEDAEAFLRESGAIVRASVEGLIGLLLARSELKKEMRAEDRTMVASKDNNPLKLMTDPQEAMGYLFDKRQRLSGAFLPPVQAMQDACDDLRVHEIALMAGMRAAFQGALKRFDPQLIEREVDKQKGAFTLNKKVKLWEAFVAHHDKLTRDAEDDLLKVFGKELLGTYMAQVKRLRSGR
jgi:type VI secretion system FHA domain protein